MATELGVDWVCVPGTGWDGRIREADIRNAAATPKVMGLSPRAGRSLSAPWPAKQKTVAVTLHHRTQRRWFKPERQQLKSGEFFTLRNAAAFDASNRPPLDKGGLQGGLDNAELHIDPDL